MLPRCLLCAKGYTSGQAVMVTGQLAQTKKRPVSGVHLLLASILFLERDRQEWEGFSPAFFLPLPPNKNRLQYPSPLPNLIENIKPKENKTAILKKQASSCPKILPVHAITSFIFIWIVKSLFNMQHKLLHEPIQLPKDKQTVVLLSGLCVQLCRLHSNIKCWRVWFLSTVQYPTDSLLCWDLKNPRKAKKKKNHHSNKTPIKLKNLNNHLWKSVVSSLLETTGYLLNRSQLDCQNPIYNIHSLVKWGLDSVPVTNKELTD